MEQSQLEIDEVDAEGDPDAAVDAESIQVSNTAGLEEESKEDGPASSMQVDAM